MKKTTKSIIAFVGMPGAGKSSCITYLEGRGYPSVYFGGITLDEVRKKGLPVNEANEKKVREDLRKNEGKTVFAKRIIVKIDRLFDEKENRVIADGLYSWSEYKAFKKHYGENAIIVAIVAPRHVRHERLSIREVRPLIEAEVTSREYAEIEHLEKGGPIANADFTITNNEDVSELHQQLDFLLQELDF